jgi:hypothetical protein
MSEWQDIATAPKDQNVIIARRSGRVCIAKYDRQEFHRHPSPYWRDNGPFGVKRMQEDAPTHWMEIPDPPKP